MNIVIRVLFEIFRAAYVFMIVFIGNFVSTIAATINYIIRGKFFTGRLLYLLIYAVLILSFISERQVFLLIMGIYFTLELYISIKAVAEIYRGEV